MKHHKRTTFFLTSLLAVSAAGCASAVGPDQPANAPPEQVVVPIGSEATSPGDPAAITAINLSYPIAGTNQGYCYGNSASIPCPIEDESFYGQDAQYSGIQSSYTDNDDGTVTDALTGLMWQQDPGAKMTYNQAVAGAENFDLAGYDDWRLPTIKELYSLILFSGDDPSGCNTEADCPGIEPFIDTDYFEFEYGNTNAGERLIDSQFISSTEYVGETFGELNVFGVNFADGRIKGYGTGPMPGQSTDKEFFVLYVRGNTEYGVNDYVDNGDSTITDQAAGLTWMQNDSGAGMIWEDALSYCESLDHAGYDDWRLPDAKELQSIVDYTRSPSTTNSAAIDPLFTSTAIIDEKGDSNYPFYWTNTTHVNWATKGAGANYVAFGEALGYMDNQWVDVHGAGSQRSDPKTGDPVDYPTGHGPQGDAIRIFNYARCVRGGNTNSSISTGGELDPIIGSGSLPSNSGPGQSGGQPGSQPGEGKEPPQEAVDACTGLSEGAVCSMTTPGGSLSGSCINIQSQLACLPAGAGPGGSQP